MSVHLFHYTCDHGRACIGDDGWLIPGIERPLNVTPTYLQRVMLSLIWLTDLDTPVRDALGLTSHILDCDRTAHRYRAVEFSARPWTIVRRDMPAVLRDELEAAPGVMPMHWWVATSPVRVLYDPIATAGAA